MEELFAVSAPGLESFTAHELSVLGLQSRPATASYAGGENPSAADDEGGGVAFQGGLEDIYHANLHLRTASRVLVRMENFYAAAFSELRKKAARLNWERFISPGQPVAVRATSHKSRLYHSSAVAERVLGAIGDRLGQPSPAQKFTDQDQGPLPQLVLVRIVNNQVTISIDSSGELLHRRGYRLETAKAPLRETLAAGMLLASGWDQTSPLLDPFCGSGTIPIEAAQMAAGLPPGRFRRFAFMDWPHFEPALWESVLTANRTPTDATLAPITASDRDRGAVESAQLNAERAGVAKRIDFSVRPISGVEPPAGTGWVVTNPPYGKRVQSSKDLRNLYAELGNLLRARCPGWQVAVLSSDARLLHAMGLQLDTGLRLVNGGVPVMLARGTVSA